MEEVTTTIDGWLRSKGLDSQNVSDENGVLEFKWKRTDYKSALELVDAMMGTLVAELIGSHKVVCTGDGAVGDSLDFSPPLRRTPIIRHLEDSTGYMFREDEFAEDPNTGVLLDLLYTKFLPTFIAPQLVTEFPKVCCKHRQGGRQRFDLVVVRQVVITVILYEGEDPRDSYSHVAIKAKALAEIFEKLTDSQLATHVFPEEWQLLSKTKMEEVPDLLEKIQESLNDIWKGRVGSTMNASMASASACLVGRSQTKILFLMGQVSTDLIKYAQTQLGENIKMDLWRGPWNDVRHALQQIMTCCDTWAKITEELTGVHWRGDWEGPKHVDPLCRKFSDRAEQILNLRGVHEQLLGLLKPVEIQELRVKEAFIPFNAVSPLNINPLLDGIWAKAVKAFERRLEPIELRVAIRLRQMLTSVANQPHTMMAEFQRYNDLIKRPTISQELSQERDTLLVKLSERVDSLRADFDHKQNRVENDDAADEDRKNQAGRNMPGVVNTIVWVRQVTDRVTQTMKTCKQLLADLPRMEGFGETCKNFLEELSDYEKELFTTWQEEVVDRMQDDDDPIGVDTSQTLMKLGSDGRIKVNFSERLVEVMKEVRLLQAMGFSIPKEIVKMTVAAQKFFRHGVALKQVANFYNTMDKELIQSHLAILLEPAKQFEAVINANKKKAVTWNKTDEAEKYISRLTSASQQLTSKNKRLRQVHQEMADKVSSLMDLDLLNNEDKWASIVKQLRNRFYQLEHGMGFKHLDQWKTHWDYQLYKAMEHQYQKGLETLNENLTELKCELVFRNEAITFRPSMETIREKYYQKMKDFISYPTSFRGVAESSFFRQMPDRNGPAISTVYQNAERLFVELGKVKKLFREHVLLGKVDLEALVHDTLTEVHQWEANFKMVKAKGKEVSAIENFIKVDCISVSTAPIKATIEDHLQRLGDLLTSSLKKAAQDHITKVDEFLNAAFTKLDIKPETIDEIGQANQAYQDMREEMPSMLSEFAKFETKAKLLKSVAGFAPDSSATKKRWDAFHDKLEGVEKVIEAQLEKMKQAVNDAVTEYMADFTKFQARWNELKPKDINVLKTREDIKEKGILFVKSGRTEFDELKTRADQIVQQAKYFQMPEPNFAAVEDMEQDVHDFEEMWNLYETFDNELTELASEEWRVFRTNAFKFEDYLRDWGERLKEYPSNNIVLFIRDKMDKWAELSPLLKYLRGDGFTLDHWLQLFRLCEMDSSISPESLQLSHFLAKCQVILDKVDDLKALHARAQGEIQIREALQEVEVWAQDMEFKMLKKEGGRSVSLIVEWKEVITSVSDMQSLLSSLKDSPYFSLFADKANAWEKKFITLDESLMYMMQMQRKWVYLEPIFGKGALAAEEGRFKHVDQEFVSLLKKIEKKKLVITVGLDPNLPVKLKSLLEQLDRCQKALSEYLEDKRDKFPRFYFIGDDDLLEILGQSQNPSVIQAHLKKLFAGIHKVDFNEEMTHIVAMKSSDGEVVPLVHPVVLTSDVEVWLMDLDREMRETLKQNLRACHEKTDFIKYPSQILNLAENIHFTVDTEKAILNKQLEEHKASLEQQLADCTSADEDEDKLQQLKMKALVLDLIHNIDVVNQLIEANVTTLQHWQWQKQLRFYFDEKRNCIIRMVDGKFNYTYEYQGNAMKLVHTPLTDKCYLTLTQGMHLGYGGNPYGPAGTGKTESVKALGNAFGRQVLVFNCDEGIDFKSMGRIFQGLCKCGAWGCFDEFNRLKEDQLSAISQMIQVIQDCLKKGEKSVHFLSKTIDLNLNAGIFVTLNPAGKAYGGRSKLPDNLKQLFRPIAMASPDNALIAEVELYSEGFSEAKIIGGKVVEIFSLSKQLLSSQQHYDWGLRPLKTILRVAGALIHAEKKKIAAALAEGQEPPKRSKEENFLWEASLVIKSLRINTLSKLTFADSKRFNELVRDMFPGVKVDDIAYEELTEKVKETLEEMQLQVLDGQLHKVMQLYESLNQRMGVVIVGPSGSGKSTLLKVLRRALQKLGINMPQYVMNPKAMNREQLLGYMDMDTREWYDGVLTAASRKVVMESLETRSWIVCDGDIDPEWIESLNSVLDDNRLLTMPNGERIQFGYNVNFVFETHSLAFASPATVSRMAVIYLSEEDVDSNAAVRSWLREQAEDLQHNLGKWVGDYLYKAIDQLRATNALVVKTTLMALVKSGLAHIATAKTKEEFTLGLIRGLGGYLEPSKREGFARDMYKLTGEKPMDPTRPLDTYVDPDIMAPSLYTYSYSGELDVDGMLKSQMVMTIDAQRNLDMIKPWIEQRQPFLLVGPEGAGKSMLVNNLGATMDDLTVATISCSAQTTCVHVIQKLNQVCTSMSTNAGRILKPKDSDRLLLFMKDLNLPRPDKYATVQVHAFLAQLILYEGFYNAELEWVGVRGIQIAASMNPSGGIGRYPLVSRFTALLKVAYIPYPPKNQLQEVYCEYLGVLMNLPPLDKNPTWGGGKNADELSNTLVAVYDAVKVKFTQEQHSHYLFTPRDLTNWVINLLNYDMEQNDLLDCVYYEASRLFCDRLVSPEERMAFDMILVNALGNQWQYEKKENEFYFVSWLDSGGSKKKSKKKKGPTLPEGKRLVNIAFKDFKKAMDASKLGYTREYRDMDLLEISETLLWICRTDRILAQPGGSMLVTGRSGVGRRDAVALAAYMLRMPVLQLNMTKGYNVKSFKTDIRNALQMAGVQGEHVCLIIEDHNLVHPSFLEMINSLLASGEVPGLYDPTEMGALLAPLQEQMVAEGFPDGPFAYFVSRIQKYLHVCLLMDPTNDQYEVQCQSNPALYTRCAIQWMGTWSSQGYAAVPRLLLEDLFKLLSERAGEEGKDEVVVREKQISHDLVTIHETNSDLATPRMFRQFCKVYYQIFREKLDFIVKQKERLVSGLQKLNEAEQAVDVLSRDAEVKKKELTKKQAQADEAMEDITKSMEKMTDQKKEVSNASSKIKKESKEMEKKKGQIEKSLSSIQPIIDAAKEAVNCIKAENLTEIRALKMPPDPIRDVLEGVLCVMGIYDTSWISMKRFLGQRGVKERILSFDAKDINSEIRDSVKSLIESKPNSFKPEAIRKASVAAAPLAQWVTANIEYASVLDSVGPMQAELDKLEKNLKKSTKKLEEADAQLKKLERKLKDSKKTFKGMTADAEKLKADLEKAESVLAGAQELLSKLGGEKVRWDSQTQVLDDQLTSLQKMSLIAAAFTTYLGAYPEDQRQRQVKKWCEMLNVSTFEFQQFMRNESELLQYKSEGLPADELSIQNSIVILEAPQTPLIIDPASQAVEWLKEHLSQQGTTVEVTTAADERFSTIFELAVRFGKVLIVNEVDKVDPVLYPILRKDLMSAGPKKTVQVGDKQIDWQDSFKLFLVTRDTNITLPPDAKSLITEVNFAITRSGLEGQLLGVTINHEKPELEEQKSKLLAQEEEYKMQLSKLEDVLLRDLAESETSLLENKALIDSLNEIKTKSVVIVQSLEEGRSLQESLDRQRNVYRPFAAAGSILFFLMKDLPSVNHMYQFSLTIFLRLFGQALAMNKEAVGDTSDKIQALKYTLMRITYFFVCRSLFKEDRLLFGMHMCQGLFPASFEKKEWDLFMGRAVVAGGGRAMAPSWLDPDTLPVFRAFEAYMPQILQIMNLDGDADNWYRWMRSKEPESMLPSGLHTKITPFQHLLITQTFRPDRVPNSMDNVIVKLLKLDQKAPVLDLVQVVEEESCSTEPLLLVTTPGADPSQELQDLAEKKVGREKFMALAMGGGQTEGAITLLKECAAQGTWLCLKNLHLVVAWLPQLEKEFNMLEPHENFRLWLTSEPHDKFPALLLTQSLKITFQAPPGIKNNMMKTYTMWSPVFLRNLSPFTSGVLFILAWFHAVVQERRNYIPQGWVKFHEFSTADLRCAADIIVTNCQKELPDWPTLYGLFENAIYGGRMDSVADVRVLQTYLSFYFNNEIVGLGPNATTWKDASPAVKRSAQLFKGIVIPQSNDHAEFVKTISGLWDTDGPQHFMLPANADRLVQRMLGARIVDNLNRLGTMSSKGSFNREQWVAKLQPLLNVWESLTKDHTGILFNCADPTPKSLTPVSSFVCLEMAASLKLMKMVGEVFREMRAVIAGTALLTSTVQAIAQTLMEGEVPRVWEKIWEGPEQPLQWLRGVVTRAVAIHSWVERDAAGKLLTSKLHLNDLFNPGTFLNALRQETAQASGIALDDLRLDCAWGEGQSIHGAHLMIQVAGLNIQGVRFDEIGKVVELSADSPALNPAPTACIAWVRVVQTHKHMVSCPVYYAGTREKHLCDLSVPCHWDHARSILTGFALLLDA